MAYYGFGRLMIELFLRIDHSQELLGLRIHVWTAGLLVVLGLIMLGVYGRRPPQDRDERPDAGTQGHTLENAGTPR
ncbi:hypothetical protein A5N15_05870 [Rothia kristinae]|uniref:Prolipoprotein diacylglyceryl transferase n=1 Tax=Rothia kristinae TaxID=37923 RepID=A0A657IUU4_9MICC|nr:hypothetical protein A5N15_05870 [Rothia kristinae]